MVNARNSNPIDFFLPHTISFGYGYCVGYITTLFGITIKHKHTLYGLRLYNNNNNNNNIQICTLRKNDSQTIFSLISNLFKLIYLKNIFSNS